MNWVWFGVVGVVAYVVLAIMGQLSAGDANSPLATAARLFRPYAFAALIVGNALWTVAFYYGLKETKGALPMLIALGMVTSFVWSLTMGNEFSLQKLAGVALVLVGIGLMA
jgi:hypothetical protein